MTRKSQIERAAKRLTERGDKDGANQLRGSDRHMSYSEAKKKGHLTRKARQAMNHSHNNKYARFSKAEGRAAELLKQQARVEEPKPVELNPFRESTYGGIRRSPYVNYSLGF